MVAEMEKTVQINVILKDLRLELNFYKMGGICIAGTGKERKENVNKDTWVETTM